MDCTQLEHEKQDRPQTSIRILEHLRFQKFRYHGENRPGKKNQKKEFMTLEVSNLQGTGVRVCILCVDADVQDKVKIHPNGLIGADCHHGLYDMSCPVPASAGTFQIVIPYIRIERMKCKKESKDAQMEVMKTRMSYLPSPYKEYFTSQCADVAWSKDCDMTKVRLAVIVSAEGSSAGMEKPLSISNVIKDGCQNTSLDILKLSCKYVPASSGACVDIFTTENSPSIKPGEYTVYVTYQPPGASGKLEHWTSQDWTPGEDCIIYNKVISYKVPPYEPGRFLTAEVKATLHLVCPSSNLSCSYPFYYVPDRGGTEFLTQNDDDGEEMNLFCPRRKQSVKRTRYESSDDSEIAASLKIKMKPIIKGTATSQVRSNRVMAPEPDLIPLTSETQHSNVKITTGTNWEFAKTMQPPPDTGDSKSSNNIWMRSTSVRHDDQKVILPDANVKTEIRVANSEMNLADCQLTGYSTFGVFPSDNANIMYRQQRSFDQEMGVTTRTTSMPSGSVRGQARNVAVTTGLKAKPPYSISQHTFSNHYQFMPQSAALQQDSSNSLSERDKIGKGMPQNAIDNQHTAAGLTQYANWQQGTPAWPEDSGKDCWVGQEKTGKCIPDHVEDPEKARAISKIVEFLQGNQETRRFNTDNSDLGQFSPNFLTNSDISQANSVNQTAPTVTSDYAGTYYCPLSLDLLDLFAEPADNLSSIDILQFICK